MIYDSIPKVTIVAFADESYFPLLYELVISIREHASPEQCAISILNAGLSDEQLHQIRPHVQHIAPPKWDLQRLPFYKKRKPQQMAFTCLPFLPSYFPGYDVYIWLDADCWVADWDAIELFIEGAMRRKLTICSSVDRSYSPVQFIKWMFHRPHKIRSFLYKHAKKVFGARVAEEMALLPELNTGAFALHREAPHWAVWAKLMEAAAPRARVYGIDQLTAAMMIYREGLPVELLPAWCNWLCARALPIIDNAGGKLLEPYLPHHPIGIMHLAGLNPERSDPNLMISLETTDGGRTERSLRYTLPSQYGEAAKVFAF